MMVADLLSIIGNEDAVSAGGFSGAVFLTYTLNLTFYEQIVARQLDWAGCSNVLIVADPDGYANALQMGAKSVSACGLEYVCAPVKRNGIGVQHVKVVLMAGPTRGRLLIGSGNLTLHGYGRNLELFSQFEFDAAHPQVEDHYALKQTWQLLQRLERDEYLSQAARSHLDVIREKATWLADPVVQPDDFQVFHNYDESIWSQVQYWRQRHGLSSESLQTLRVVSPYYDKDVGTLGQLTDELQPRKVDLYVSPATTNLNGRQLKQSWTGRATKLTAWKIEGASNKRARPLHAKAIIGVEQSGAWCIAGSANLTRMALTKNWSTGGNLELVTFRWSPNRTAFDYLLEDEAIRVREIKVADIKVTDEEPSERTDHVEDAVVLTDLSVERTCLTGKLSRLPAGWLQHGQVRLLRAGMSIPVEVDHAGQFTGVLPQILKEAEAARLEIGDWATPYRWIDNPDALGRFGERSYQARVRAKLETFDGAGKLFEELMNYLWTRVDRTQVKEEEEQAQLTRLSRTRSKHEQASDDDSPPPPPPDAFITDEKLREVVGWRVGLHASYDRSSWSLRDLLSLALLRLTTPTQAPDTTDNNDDRDEEADQNLTLEQESARATVLQRLRDYLLRYCRQYSRRLIDSEFVNTVGSALLFNNHMTLGRVLLEFAETVDAFTSDDLFECFWLVWAPLVWPSVIGLDGPSTLEVLQRDHDRADISKTWNDSGMERLSIAVLGRALGEPPDWQDGLGQPDRVDQMLAGRELIRLQRMILGQEAFDANLTTTNIDVLSIKSLEDLYRPANETEDERFESLRKRFEAIANYLPPAEKRLASLMRFQTLKKSGRAPSKEMDDLRQIIIQQGLEKELADCQNRPVPILPARFDDDEEEFFCPKCLLQLIERQSNDLEKGKLVLCSNCSAARLFWRPPLPEVIL